MFRATDPGRHREAFRLAAGGIIEALDLRRPIYKPTAASDTSAAPTVIFPWERLGKAAALAMSAAWPMPGAAVGS